METRNLKELLAATLHQNPNKSAVISSRDQVLFTHSYGDLSGQVNTVGRYLIRCGIGKGDRIGLMSENRLEWIIAYLAVVSIGAVIVPISIFWEVTELSAVLKSSKMRSIFTSNFYLEKLLPLLNPNQDSSLESAICFDDPDDAEYKSDRVIGFSGIFSKTANEADDADIQINPDDTAEILFVSSKLGIKLSHASILANIEGIVDTLYTDRPNDRKIMTIFPYSHLYPTVFGILLPLYMGWSVIISDNGRMDRIFKMIKQTRPEYILMVPLLLERFLNRLEMRLKKKTISELGFDLNDFIFVAGVKCPERLIEKANLLGLKVLEGYGVSEMSPFISVNTKTRHRIGSVGIPLSNVQVRIDTVHGDREGEVWAKGPNLMTGYLNASVIKKKLKKYGALKVMPDGWIQTGDTGWIDENGFLYITGRSRNIIVNQGGANIYPDEIESQLVQHPLIREIRIVMASDQTSGEYPCAEIYMDRESCTEYNENDLDKIVMIEIESLSGKIAAYKIPKDYRIILR